AYYVRALTASFETWKTDSILIKSMPKVTAGTVPPQVYMAPYCIQGNLPQYWDVNRNYALFVTTTVNGSATVVTTEKPLITNSLDSTTVPTNTGVLSSNSLDPSTTPSINGSGNNSQQVTNINNLQLPTPIVITLVAVAFAILILLCIVAFLLIRKRKQKKLERNVSEKSVGAAGAGGAGRRSATPGDSPNGNKRLKVVRPVDRGVNGGNNGNGSPASPGAGKLSYDGFSVEDDGVNLISNTVPMAVFASNDGTVVRNNGRGGGGGGVNGVNGGNQNVNGYSRQYREYNGHRVAGATGRGGNDTRLSTPPPWSPTPEFPVTGVQQHQLLQQYPQTNTTVRHRDHHNQYLVTDHDPNHDYYQTDTAFFHPSGSPLPSPELAPVPAQAPYPYQVFNGDATLTADGEVVVGNKTESGNN
ncbi:hypothetical protein HDU76_010523, partial [Blyttiomyces sp. JEL0837]